MNAVAMIILTAMMLIAIAFLVAAAAMWTAGKRIEIRIRKLDSQLGSSSSNIRD